MSEEHPGILTVGGFQRTFHVVAPDTPPHSMLMVLHGSDSDAAGIRALSGHTFDRLSGQGVLVVYPEAYQGMWNDARLGTQAPARELGIDDVEYVSSLAEGLRRQYDVPAERVFAAGFSNGGQMVIRLVLEVPDLIAGAAVIGSNHPTAENVLPGASERDQHREMPVLCVSGTKDPIVPFEGGVPSVFGVRPRGPVMSSFDSACHFAARNGITREPVTEQVTTGRLATTVTRWREDGHAPVDFYAVEGGGHTIPNPDHRAPLILGRTARNLDAAVLVRDFFGLGA